MEAPVDQAENRRQPKGFIETLFYYYAALVMLALVALVIYVVAARYLFNRPPIWGEDVPRLVFLWGVFLSAPLAIRLRFNIRVNAIDHLLPLQALRWLKLCLHFLVLVLLAVIFVNSWPLVELAMRGTMLSTGWNNSVLRLPILIGAAMMFVAQLDLMLGDWRNSRH